MPVQITITPILPPKNYFGKKADDIADAITAVLKGKVSDILTKELERRADGWSNRPKWNSRVSKFTLVLSTRSKKWLWVSGGTRARPIFPRRAKYLAIRSYKPLTTVTGVHGAAGGGKYVGSYTYAKSAPNYPGIGARAFEEKIVKIRTIQVQGIIQAAVDGA